ncbi:MAG: hypothetical protein K0S32_4435 [Bacteroidetes bacterium]|jgi:hypothetical protein|nr:hypothetical protein [Bacteroidota bacterium]
MKKLILGSCIAIIAMMYSCRKDFIVEDIDNKTITVNAPANNLVTDINSITFWWELLEGAEKYNIQIVKPGFSAIAQLVADTNVATNKFTMTLQPGTYQWRIKAFNAGHSTGYQTFNLKIDSSNVLTNQTVVPISPLTGTITNNKTINFSWNALPAATNYSVEISLNNAVINYSITSATNYAYTFTLGAAANYTVSWRAKAINATSVSQYNTPQTFIIDLLPPTSVSTPTYPMSNPIVKDTIELRWNRSSTDTQYDSLFVYSDAAFSNLVRTTSVSATSIKINAISPGNPLPAGTGSASPIPYWWRLKSVDNAGNSTSGFSNSLNFQLIQP